MGVPKAKKLFKPNVFDYHDYREFLNDQCEYLNAKSKSYSMRKMCMKAGLSPSYMALVTTKRRGMTKKALGKVVPQLGINQSEARFLGYLRDLEEADNQNDRKLAYQKMRKFGMYRSHNQQDMEAHHYLTAWYYFAIREMSNLPNFRLDPKWIQKRLHFKVSLSEIRECLSFLVKHGYILMNDQGHIEAPEKPIVCDGGIYRLGQSEFHKQVLELAVESIYSVERQQRSLSTHTMAIPEDSFEEVRDVLESALKKVQRITRRAKGESVNSVYQVSLLAFPLAKDSEGGADQ